MTLRELVDISGLGNDEEAIGFLMIAFQILRSSLQQEQATFEGCCASALRWTELYGSPTPNKVRQWLDDIGRLAEFNIPDEFIAECMTTED